jgi:hypothetical protein
MMDGQQQLPTRQPAAAEGRRQKCVHPLDFGRRGRQHETIVEDYWELGGYCDMDFDFFF